MIKPTSSSRESQQARLEEKTRDAKLVQEVVDGTGMSRWEAETLTSVVKRVYLSDPENRPLQCGEMRYTCVASDEGPGKKLNECRKVTVIVTLLSDEDNGVVVSDEEIQGSVRRRRLARIAEEAREQGGLLTQEDLSQLLMVEERTVRRDIQYLRSQYGIIVPTRGQQKDIGPGVSHRGLAIRYWLEGHEPLEVARRINHTVKAVDRYIDQFSRVVYLHQQSFNAFQIALTVGINTSSVNTSVELLHEFRHRPCFQQRLEEINIQGARYYLAEDQEKGGPLQGANLNEGGSSK